MRSDQKRRPQGKSIVMKSPTGDILGSFLLCDMNHGFLAMLSGSRVDVSPEMMHQVNC